MQDTEKNLKKLLFFFLLPEEHAKGGHLTVLSVGFALFVTLKGKFFFCS